MSELPRVHILTPSLVPYDAIGNDVAQMRDALRQSGYLVDAFAEGIHTSCATLAEPLNTAPEEYWLSPDDILLYHHSTGWPLGEAVLFRSQNKIILRYHNITPAAFFEPYSVPHAQACQVGVESTKRIAKLRGMTILGDSTFNCEDLIARGAESGDCQVLAPFHLTEDLGREPFDIPTVQQYSGDVVNILFVGGIKPNKGHARAIRVFAEYHHRFNARSRLVFVGGIDDRLQGYISHLRQLATDLNVASGVIFTGSVTGSQIKSLYVAADVFLCTSEHEGFCVPLVEAMYFRVPIVAWGVTAVPETLGGCGFVLEEWDEFLFAKHIAALVDAPDLAEHFGDLGRSRYRATFHPAVLKQKLSELIAEVGRPRTGRNAMGAFG